MLTGYLKIGDIAGESQRAEHEDEIDIHDIKWNIEQGSAAQVGRGRSRSRAQVDAIFLRKFTDAASAYLALACMQGKSFPDMVLSVRKDSGDAHLDYLIITMENVTISKFEVLGTGDGEGGQMIEEVLGLVFENVTYKYTVQADDHSAGDEHEITYDIAAGV
ncbi:Hcp family type VI secretion system effector [Yoonia sediminilitoris]|uniref:Type VI secretion system secreted protein Hcp n=1 Tax=Yoonia sediminilitoris TaxID=1286148 RepID=A0A2T6KM28_9RHOB|nr:type VI secretion system tube protein Hcp [Yoonia sediminilitoris]PUB17272.1 type VI secretion system secreted protein Hcp [Yoonia sediminilitoris]RCW97567.1 type VI secretion system secreted protein Hcp [Yoonia sediminilitoris]